jgi:hypothetical protein
MKRFQNVVLIFATLLLVSACASSAPRHMMFKEDPASAISSVKPESGKAALVVGRSTSFGGAIEFDTYLDKVMIGVSKWKSYFFKTDVVPGVHYVISKAENMEPVKINFEPDRVYYIHQIPRMGVWKARISIALLTQQELISVCDNSCRLLVYDTKNVGDNLSDDDFKKAVDDYEKDVKEGQHKEYLDYKGMSVK